MKKRYILLLTATVLITLGGCAKDAENTQTSGSESVSNEQSTSEEDKGGMSSSDSDDMEVSAQKAYDLKAAYSLQNANNQDYIYMYSLFPNEIFDRYCEEHENEDMIISEKKCELNYDALTEEEKKEFDKWYPDLENHYTFYENEGVMDMYVKEVFDMGVVSDEVKNLPENAYNSMYVFQYAISDGKIYGKFQFRDKEYKIEGDLAVNEIPVYDEQELEENYREMATNNGDDIHQLVEDYKSFLEEWKTSSYQSDYTVDVEYNAWSLMFKIKDFRDDTLIVEDCYRIAPSFIDYYGNILYN